MKLNKSVARRCGILMLSNKTLISFYERVCTLMKHQEMINALQYIILNQTLDFAKCNPTFLGIQELFLYNSTII